VRSFRFQWPADLCTSFSFEMENLILSWYILVETGSVLMLAIFASLQYIGTCSRRCSGSRRSHRSSPALRHAR
jgi:hypothetical protein